MPSPNQCCAFEIILNSADNLTAGVWHKVGRVGQWLGHPTTRAGYPSGYGVTEEDLRSMFDAFGSTFAANGASLVVDYRHASLIFGKEAPAAGWADKLEMRAGERGSELWANIRWTDRAAEQIRSGEYRYLSPTYNFGIPDRVSGQRIRAFLNSIALTNDPFLTDFTAHANSGGVAADPSTAAPDGGANTMASLLERLAAAQKSESKAVANSLGVAPDASDDQVITAVASKLSQTVANSQAATDAAARVAVFANSLGVAPDATAEAVKAKADALKAAETTVAVVANSLGIAPDTKPEEMAKKITELRGQAADRQAETVVNSAVEARKIPPAMRAWWTERMKADPAGTQQIINSLPATLSNSSGVAGAPPPNDATPEQEFANSTAIREEFGDAKTYAAYRQAVKEGRVIHVVKS